MAIKVVLAGDDRVAGGGGVEKGLKRAVLYYYVPVDFTSIDKLGVGSTLACT